MLDSKYQLGEELGRGSSGKVYRALNRETGDFRAIKEIRSRRFAYMPPYGINLHSKISILHSVARFCVSRDQHKV